MIVPEAKIGDVRRLRFRTIAIRGLDDLKSPAPYAVSPQLATLAVRRLRRRAAVMFLVGFALLAAFVTAANVVETGGEELAATGARTEGIVVDTVSRSRFTSGSITVRFSVGGAERVRSINLNDTSPEYHPGDTVTVIYDPADPERIATPDTGNDPYWVTLLIATTLVASAIVLPSGGICLVRWSRRLRSVRRHGWRQGRADIGDTRWQRTILTIFTGPDVITVATTRPIALPIPFDVTRSAVHLGGQGKHLTVMFLTGPFLVPAKPAG